MIIFLDIDGVMVPAKGWKAPELLQDGFPMFSDKAVSALNALITGETLIMLTTSHKSKFSLNEWELLLLNRGVKPVKIDRLPDSDPSADRRMEIASWFNVHSIDKDFIILDDDKCLNGLPLHLKNHLIQPSPYIGLTPDHVKEARAILATGPTIA